MSTYDSADWIGRTETYLKNERLGGSDNVNVHVHVVFLEGVYFDRAAQGLKRRFVKVEPPSDMFRLLYTALRFAARYCGRLALEPQPSSRALAGTRAFSGVVCQNAFWISNPSLAHKTNFNRPVIYSCIHYQR